MPQLSSCAPKLHASDPSAARLGIWNAKLRSRSIMCGAQSSGAGNIATTSSAKMPAVLNATVLALTMGGAAALYPVGNILQTLLPANAAVSSSIEIRDFKKVSETLQRNIYDTRGQELTESPRQGEASRFALASTDYESTKKRTQESLKRMKNQVPKLIESESWALANAELRRQMGTLKYDMNDLAKNKGLKPAKSNKAVYKALDTLDYNVRQKNKDKALKLVKEAEEAIETAYKLYTA